MCWTLCKMCPWRSSSCIYFSTPFLRSRKQREARENETQQRRALFSEIALRHFKLSFFLFPGRQMFSSEVPKILLRAKAIETSAKWLLPIPTSEFICFGLLDVAVSHVFYILFFNTHYFIFILGFSSVLISFPHESSDCLCELHDN